MIKLYNIKTTLIIAVMALANTPTWAQGMNNNAWAPEPSNRAAIASLIRQVEQNDTSSNSGALGYATSNVTQLICGSNSGESPETSANAQANSSCIILNNSDGALNINQDSLGNQITDANSMSSASLDEVINETDSVEDVLTILAKQ